MKTVGPLAGPVGSNPTPSAKAPPDARVCGTLSAMSEDLDAELPRGLTLTRTTPRFDAETVPAGLLNAHRVADGVWGVLRVEAGSLTFVVETTGSRRVLHAGDQQVIPPTVLHHVELGPDAAFRVEFWR